MKLITKQSLRSIALVLPLLAGCAAEPADDASDAASEATKEPDLKKPELSPDGKSTQSGGFVVNPYFTTVLQAGSNRLPVGGSTTLTITANQDLGPTPYYITIFDATTATRLASCGFGTTCSATVSQSSATTHAYVAYIGASSSTMPPTSLVATSPKTFVSWSDLGYSVSIAPVGCVATQNMTVTATANIDVGPTIYYIEIFDGSTGTRLKSCGTGTTCSVTWNCGSIPLNAFISANSTTFPPASSQASSATVVPFVSLL
jgi:hypothetical protein